MIVGAVRIGLPRAVAVAALFATLGCSAYDESKGTFTLTASGDLDVVTHGPVSAYHLPILSSIADEYHIVLDVDSASPPFQGFHAVMIATASRVASDVRFVHTSAQPSNADRTANVDLLPHSGSSDAWLADSATVNFKSVRGHHAVAGDFTLYVNCKFCEPAKRGAHAVLRGSFQTHD